MTQFTLNNGAIFTQQDNGYNFRTFNGKKTRCSKADFEAAHAQFVKEENARQNAQNHFTNIDPLTETDDANTPAILNQYGCVDCSKCNVKHCIHRDCMRRNPVSVDGLGLCPRLHIKTEEQIVEEAEEIKEEEAVQEAQEEIAAKPKRTRKSKDIGFTGTIILADDKIADVTLTTKQVAFMMHLSDSCFWERGLQSSLWVDVLCDEIGGEFAGKPMTVGAMISTLCEKGIGRRFKERINNRKCTCFELTELGQKVAEQLGLE